ncbi:Uncharacterised protein [Mycobacterium tuberculosis]|uniref:Uncharacterized protein n=1 Tax=Mycobacterium tuberculosis TaxID=1773 RepID=A0A654TVV8_MYCTX|nr:Uncharacterised protein [Mycobacterium tuberculosis]
MPGCVQQLDVDVADADLVPMLMGDQVADRNPSDSRNPQRFMGVHVHGYRCPLQQLSQSRQLKTHHRAAHMVWMMVGHQHTR